MITPDEYKALSKIKNNLKLLRLTVEQFHSIDWITTSIGTIEVHYN